MICGVKNGNRLEERESEERLDPENGILLSPNADALFDRNLISFADTGEIIQSSKVSVDVLRDPGIDASGRIEVTEGMKKYLERHRAKLLQ